MGQRWKIREKDRDRGRGVKRNNESKPIKLWKKGKSQQGGQVERCIEVVLPFYSTYKQDWVLQSGYYHHLKDGTVCSKAYRWNLKWIKSRWKNGSSDRSLVEYHGNKTSRQTVVQFNCVLLVNFITKNPNMMLVVKFNYFLAA